MRDVNQIRSDNRHRKYFIDISKSWTTRETENSSQAVSILTLLEVECLYEASIEQVRLDYG